VETRKPEESTITVIKRAIERDGLLSLFNGLDSSLAAIGVTNFVYCKFRSVDLRRAVYWYIDFCFEEARHIILNIKRGKSKLDSVTLSTLESILASTLSGICTSLAVNPLWTINTRQ